VLAGDDTVFSLTEVGAVIKYFGSGESIPNTDGYVLLLPDV
jgi:hypothetical protein